ncbi:hypothetical protein ABTZ78_08385 [Streptomyces bauhiniae]|uniref:hypothetical protein n=1 Tax=Streptomyces bauhiniae TaxID=2340725 RepID=UPI00332305E9
MTAYTLDSLVRERYDAWRRPEPAGGQRESPCSRCGAALSPWESDGCGCAGPASPRNADLLYTAACTAGRPRTVAQLVRHVHEQYGKEVSTRTASAFLYRDPRFCWAGPRRYGLYRHGPLPGPRTLEQAARLTLHCAPRPLPLSTVVWWLRGLGYEFHERSLRVCAHRSEWTQRLDDGRTGIRLDATDRDLLCGLVLGQGLEDPRWPVLKRDIAKRLTTATAFRPAEDTADACSPLSCRLDWSDV